MGTQRKQKLTPAFLGCQRLCCLQYVSFKEAVVVDVSQEKRKEEEDHFWGDWMSPSSRGHVTMAHTPLDRAQSGGHV